ncbi:MAG: tyrosine-type recombinase/integrase [Coriobacteriia bacterium]|nr:tyrosine-type recombinase/integrase [Methylobacter sp.]MDP2429060.1 tyrosine-type recombinase/integrase [Methylobacter sp.]MDP3055372.1 tyrosine-type recombinase/integrase [Methylobacter sp.]MDP3361328.1 tyrosine-type recombinase/integrase [Methylobacter sp.]MDZ4170306.1 tyrosine-type recombinase/integrase [Coriobacteriia bacterium]
MNTVDAVTKAEIDMVHAALMNKYGQLYADIWKVGVNLSLRIGDLLRLKYADLNIPERTLSLTEAKTSKPKTIRLNAAAIAVITRRRQEYPTDTWLFQVNCNRAKGKAISRVSVSRVFKETGDMLGLTINTHSMRKSRGMAMYRDGVKVETIARVLNYSNTSSTLRYLGITNQDVLQTYDDYEL